MLSNDCLCLMAAAEYEWIPEQSNPASFLLNDCPSTLGTSLGDHVPHMRNACIHSLQSLEKCNTRDIQKLR
jgi:hypothetical protein